MKTRSPLLLLLLVLGPFAVVCAWLLLDDTRALEPSVGGDVEEPVAQSPAVSADLAAPERVDAPEARAEVGAELAAELDVLTAAENFDLADAVTLRGHVVLPAGASADPTLRVLAIECPPEPALVDGQLESAQGLLADPELRFARRGVDASGRFEVPVPRDAERVLLYVDARVLVLDYAASVTPADAGRDLELAPELGCCLVVHLVTPDELPSGAPPFVRLEGIVMALVMRGEWERGQLHRTGLPDDAGTVEFRGLRAPLRASVSVSHEELVEARSDELRLAPGEVLEHTVELGYGATVVGRVVDESGAPVPSASVRLRAPEEEQEGLGFRASRATLSIDCDEEGRFERAGLEAGTWTLTAEAQGWISSPDREVEVGAPRTRSEVELALSSGESIAGRVLHPGGAPAADAPVFALANDDAKGRRRRGDLPSAKTDAEGRFRITGLQPGPHAVRAFALAPDDVPDDDVEVQADPRAWSAAAADVATGTTALELALEPPLVAGVRLIDDLDAPVAVEATVRAIPSDDLLAAVLGDVTTQFTEPTGRARLEGLRAGAWTVSASARNHGDPSSQQAIELPSEHELVFRLPRLGTITGSVLDPDGAPVAGAEVSASAPDRYRRWDESDDAPRTGADGTFVLEGVATGSQSLVARHDDWASSEPVAVEVEAGGVAQGVVLTLRRGGTLTGEAFTKQGAPAARRSVMVQSGGAGDGRLVTADDAGRFVAEHLDPGAYQVIMEPTPEEQEEIERKGERDMAAMMAAMTMASARIVDGETTHVLLGAPAADPVRVHGVVTRAGEPLAEGLLFVVAEERNILASFKPTKLAEDGSYDVTVDEPGNFVFFVKSDLSEGGVEFAEAIPEVDELRLDLALPGGTIRGRVVDSEGNGVDGADVGWEAAASLATLSVLEGGAAVDTEEDGSFEIPDLFPGTYTVRAAGSLRWGNSAHGYSRTVRVEVGEDAVVDGLLLELPAAGSVHGVVRGPDGAAVADASIHARDASGALLAAISFTATDVSGRFVQDGLSPGEVFLSARKGALVTPRPVAVTVRAGEPVEAELSLEPGTVLTITAEAEDGSTRRMLLSVTDEAGREYARMLDRGASEDILANGFSTSRRTVGPLPPGAYEIVATTPEGLRAKKSLKLTGRATRSVRLKLD